MAAVSSRGRTLPGLVNYLGGLIVLVLVASLALFATQNSPPQVAEFAPRAQHPIQQAPSEQTAAFGNAAGAAIAAGPAPSPSPLPTNAIIENCVGDPPRQIEDPQSPPCVAYWSGNNGGATASGVTGTEITIASPYQSGSAAQYYADLARFFNKRFELYGRKIRLVPCCSSHAGTVSGMQADADQVATQYHPFGSLTYQPQSGSEFAFYDELARKHVISVATWGSWRSEAQMAAYAPYEWSQIGGGNDVGESGMGAFVCSQLKGHTADHAGPPYTGQPRIFGLLLTGAQASIAADATRIKQVFDACGVPIKEQAQVNTIDSTSDAATEAQNAATAFRTAGVTTVICLCEGYAVDTIVAPAAANQNYEPEWVISTYLNMDIGWVGQLAPVSEATHFLGISFENKDLPAADQPVTWALREVDPGWTWASQSYDPSTDSTSAQWYLYDDLLILASGIQMAGPDLTPQNFQAALFRTRFPNPRCGGPPYYQACVGFPSAHSFYQDVSVIWWQPGITSYSTREGTQNSGAYCYSDLGTRHSIYSWPSTQQPIFTPTSCR